MNACKYLTGWPCAEHMIRMMEILVSSPCNPRGCGTEEMLIFSTCAEGSGQEGDQTYFPPGND
jgi:hypothetical protein